MSKTCCLRFRFKANASGFLSAKNSLKVKADIIIVSDNQPISDRCYTEGDSYVPSCVCFVLWSCWRWINAHCMETIAIPVFQTGKPPVEDLFSDLCDGRRLLQLLEGLVGHQLVWTRPPVLTQGAAFERRSCPPSCQKYTLKWTTYPRDWKHHSPCGPSAVTMGNRFTSPITSVTCLFSLCSLFCYAKFYFDILDGSFSVKQTSRCLCNFYIFEFWCILNLFFLNTPDTLLPFSFCSLRLL